MMPCHQELSTRFGIRIGEAIPTNDLADDGVYEFIFCFNPLPTAWRHLFQHSTVGARTTHQAALNPSFGCDWSGAAAIVPPATSHGSERPMRTASQISPFRRR